MALKPVFGYNAFVIMLLIQACAMSLPVAFRCFDVHNEGRLKYDELFKMYKSLFGAALNDERILDIVFRALHDTDLETPGVITPVEFNRVSTGDQPRGASHLRLKVEIILFCLNLVKKICAVTNQALEISTVT